MICVEPNEAVGSKKRRRSWVFTFRLLEEDAEVAEVLQQLDAALGRGKQAELFRRKILTPDFLAELRELISTTQRQQRHAADAAIAKLKQAEKRLQDQTAPGNRK